VAGAVLVLDGVRRLDQGSGAIADVDRWGLPAPQVVAPMLAVSETLVGAAGSDAGIGLVSPAPPCPQGGMVSGSDR